jgi:hypothetical protein
MSLPSPNLHPLIEQNGLLKENILKAVEKEETLR